MYLTVILRAIPWSIRHHVTWKRILPSNFVLIHRNHIKFIFSICIKLFRRVLHILSNTWYYNQVKTKHLPEVWSKLYWNQCRGPLWLQQVRVKFNTLYKTDSLPQMFHWLLKSEMISDLLFSLRTYWSESEVHLHVKK